MTSDIPLGKGFQLLFAGALTKPKELLGLHVGGFLLQILHGPWKLFENVVKQMQAFQDNPREPAVQDRSVVEPKQGGSGA